MLFGKINEEEYSILSKGVNTAVIAVEYILKEGIDNAMNYINSKSVGN